jgi:RES domain-containing protein
LRIEGPEIEIPAVVETDLTEGWQTRFEITRRVGTDWLRKREAVLLRLPSAIVPATTNFLFNPLRADAGRFKITEALEYPFDRRIKR